MDDRHVRCRDHGGPRRGPGPAAAATSTAAPTRRSPTPTRRSRPSARTGSASTSGTSATSTAPGIALVVRLLADARRDGRTVRAIGLTEHYREIFRITRLSDFMEIVEGDAA